MNYRYYSTQRPIMPGSYPKPEGNGIVTVYNFDNKTYAEEIQREVWGYIEYARPLGHFDIVNYELVAAKIKTLHLKYLGVIAGADMCMRTKTESYGRIQIVVVRGSAAKKEAIH